MDYYLQIFVEYFNKFADWRDLRLGRPLEIKDFNTLNSENMLKIVKFLLYDSIGKNPPSGAVRLDEFNSMGIGESTYEGDIDVIYHEVKKIFFGDRAQLFHYSVLLMPSRDLKRTKAVVAHMMEFVIMKEKLHQQFKNYYGVVQRENSEKYKICGEIDQLVDRIYEAEKARQLVSEQLPQVKAEVEKKELEIRQQQNLLSKLKAECEKRKSKFEEQERKCTRLQKELENWGKVELEWQQKLVSSPLRIQAEHRHVQERMDEQTKLRETHGKELEAMRKKCELYEKLIGRVKDVLEDIKLRIFEFSEAMAQKEATSEARDTRSIQICEVQILRNDVCKLEQQLTSLPQIQATLEEIEKHKIAIEQQKRKTEDVLEANRNAAVAMKKCEEECAKLEEEIRKFEHQIEVDLPEQKATCEADMKIHMKLLNIYREFPVLNMEPRAEYMAQLSSKK